MVEVSLIIRSSCEVDQPARVSLPPKVRSRQQAEVILQHSLNLFHMN